MAQEIHTINADDVADGHERFGLADTFNGIGNYRLDRMIEDLGGEFELAKHTTMVRLHPGSSAPAAAIDAFLRERVKPLERLEVRRAALRMVAIVSLADGFDEAEASLCRKLGDALNLSGAVVQGVLDEFAAIQQAVDEA